jgi:hypothetical protein
VTPGTYYGLQHQHGRRVEGSFRSFRCLQDLGRWCPQCAAQKILAQREDLKKAADGMWPGPKYFMNAITGKLSRDKKKIVASEDKGIVLAQVSNSVFSKLEEHRVGDWGDFTDEEDGYWVNISRKGKGQATRYPNVTPSRKSMGPLPDWVDFDDAHDCTDNTLIGTMKASEMVMLLIDSYAEAVPRIEDLLRESRERWKKKAGK